MFLLVFTLFLVPLTSSLTITDTTFFSTITNYTIFVDNMVLENVTVTNLTIEFFAISSVGSNLTNTNATFDAVANFFDLPIDFTIRNVNTSTDLFTSSLGSEDFNATFTPGQTIQILGQSSRIIPITEQTCNNLSDGFNTFFTFMPIIFTILAIIIIVSLLIGLIFLIRNPESFETVKSIVVNQDFILALSGLGFLGFLGIIFLVILGFMCTI